MKITGCQIHPGAPGREARLRAFTLVELLVVMAVIVLLAVMVIPAIKGTLDGINLTGAAESMTSQLSLARQTAMSRNVPIEVRLYNHPNGTENHYDTAALVIPMLGTGNALSQWTNISTPFGGGVVIDFDGMASTGEKFSTIFDTTNRTSNTSDNKPPTTSYPSPAGPWAVTPSTETDTTPAPFALRGLSYYAFRFLPDGSTDLPAVASDGTTGLHWCLSLKNIKSRAANDPNGTSIPASNYVSLVIDPRTGRVLSYRP